MNRTPPPQCNVDGASTVKHFPLWRRVASQATPLRNRRGACCGEVELSQDDALLTGRSLPTKFAQQRVDCQVVVQDVQAVPLHNAPASSSRSLAVSEAVPDNSPLVACRASGSAEPALNPPLKRRRLTCKQPAPESYGDVCLDVPMSWAVRRRAEQQFAAHWLKHKGGAQAPGNYDAKRRYGVHLFRAPVSRHLGCSGLWQPKRVLGKGKWQTRRLRWPFLHQLPTQQVLQTPSRQTCRMLLQWPSCGTKGAWVCCSRGTVPGLRGRLTCLRARLKPMSMARK